MCPGSNRDTPEGIPRPSRVTIRRLVDLPIVSTPEMLVELDRIAVRAGSVQILRDVTLSIGPEEAVGVFGANGAGKTTMLRLLATLIVPSGGEGRVLGGSLGSADRFGVRPEIGYIGHNPGLYDELTLLENLEFAAAARGIDRADAGTVLAAVGLDGAATRRVEHCSHGMQRRAEFARVLMTRPRLLLLDEPHSALDTDAVDLVEQIVQSTLERGGAAVLVSHDRWRVEQLCPRTVEIVGGTL